jgi:hypothetical protein
MPVLWARPFSIGLEHASPPPLRQLIGDEAFGRSCFALSFLILCLKKCDANLSAS